MKKNGTFFIILSNIKFGINSHQNVKMLYKIETYVGVKNLRQSFLYFSYKETWRYWLFHLKFYFFIRATRLLKTLNKSAHYFIKIYYIVFSSYVRVLLRETQHRWNNNTIALNQWDLVSSHYVDNCFVIVMSILTLNKTLETHKLLSTKYRSSMNSKVFFYPDKIMNFKKKEDKTRQCTIIIFRRYAANKMLIMTCKL